MRAACRLQGKCSCLEIRFASPRQILLRGCTWKIPQYADCCQVLHVNEGARLTVKCAYPVANVWILVSGLSGIARIHKLGIEFLLSSYLECKTFLLYACCLCVCACVHGCIQHVEWRMLRSQKYLCARCIANMHVFETYPDMKVWGWAFVSAVRWVLDNQCSRPLLWMRYCCSWSLDCHISQSTAVWMRVNVKLQHESERLCVRVGIRLPHESEHLSVWASIF